MRILIIFLFVFLKAEIFNYYNISVLKSLDIEKSFINFYKLHKVYNYYYTHKKDYFLNVLINGYEYIPLIKKEILKNHLPPELVSVAIAESYLKSSAYSNKRAIGIWQFIPSTAKRFGLKIDEYVDERKDPFKSTKAAIEYLNYLHKYFGKWYLALLAYNAGEARVVEGVVRAKVDKLCSSLGEKCKKSLEIKNYRKIIRNYQKRGKDKFFDLYSTYMLLKYIPLTLEELMTFQKGLKRQYIPKETRLYILKILSLSFLINSKEFIKYSNSYLLNSGLEPNLKRVKVPSGTSLYYVSKLLNMSYRDLRYYNMHLKYPYTPPYPYFINIPYNKYAEFKLKFNPKRYFYIYKVKKGDTLAEIAKSFNIKVKLIQSFNKIGKIIRVNQKLVIPIQKKIITYKVKRGDTLLIIARRFDTTFKEIMRINKLKSSVIFPGQILQIPIEF